MLQPHQRASRLRVITLASTVALVGAVPLAAAVAGEDARLAARAFEETRTHRDTVAEVRHDDAGRKERRTADQARGDAAEKGRPGASCGPEVASPEGVEVRTCVLTEGGETWARASYRNATRGALPAVLTLHGPEGHTTRVRCTMVPADDRELCETPRGRRPQGREAAAAGAYSAVAEVASADGERLLLRADSGK